MADGVPMNEIADYYAHYNLNANKEMLEALSVLMEDSANSRMKAYFIKAILRVLDHLFLSDLSQLTALMKLAGEERDLEKELSIAPQPGKGLFQTIDDFKDKRQKLDMLILTFFQGAPEEFFRTKVSFQNHNGEMVECEVWKVVIQFFNHQTHHRGQISAMLDELHIRNDYANML